MSKKNSGKYEVSENEQEVLPNLLGLDNKAEIDEAEFTGFLKAQLVLIRDMNENTIFDLKYVHSIHQLAFGELYAFAGKLRSVNISKGGFTFPAARFLPGALDHFEKELLVRLSKHYENKELFIRDLAKSHAELLYLHPYREGNGRTCRLLINLIYLKQTGTRIDISMMLKTRIVEYIKAVQQAASQEYTLMESLFIDALK